MTDDANPASKPSTSRPRRTKAEVVEDAVVVDDSGSPIAAATPVEQTEQPSGPAHAASEPAVVAVVEPVAAQEPPAQQVVYVHAPAAPKKAGNRGIGSLFALASSIVYAAVFALVVLVILAVQVGRASFSFVGQPSFYVPVLFYLVGLVLIVLILNRAGWGAYVVGSIAVGVLVYFGTIGVLVLGQGIILMTPAEAGELFRRGLADPFVIAAALVAREMALWTGAVISRRGRAVKARNVEARANWEREVAEKKAEGERAATASAAG